MPPRPLLKILFSASTPCGWHGGIPFASWPRPLDQNPESTEPNTSDASDMDSELNTFWAAIMTNPNTNLGIFNGVHHLIIYFPHLQGFSIEKYLNICLGLHERVPSMSNIVAYIPGNIIQPARQYPGAYSMTCVGYTTELVDIRILDYGISCNKCPYPKVDGGTKDEDEGGTKDGETG
jgi:hypothetical protein